MQISRHWRMNSVRYRLEATRQERGGISLQDRVNVLEETQPQTRPEAEQRETDERVAVTAA